MIPAFTSSSLNLPMSVSICLFCSLGTKPASESLVALTRIMNRIDMSTFGFVELLHHGRLGMPEIDNLISRQSAAARFHGSFWPDSIFVNLRLLHFPDRPDLDATETGRRNLRCNLNCV